MVSPQNAFHMFTTARGTTVKAIQSLLLRIGAATSGKKELLQSRLFKELSRTEFPNDLKERRCSRVLSIDMGIKNLAFCVADVRLSAPKAGAATMKVLAWQRMDLTEAMRDDSGKSEENLVEEVKTDGKEDEDPFTPESLSKMAYRLLNENLLTWQPDVVLVERQRWRSSGSSAIQQWTVRVNSLEAILWAFLTALKGERSLSGRDGSNRKNNWSTFGVDPKRVSSYWLDESMRIRASTTKSKRGENHVTLIDETDDAASPKKLSRGRAEKKAKIQLLRTWLDSGSPSTELSAHEDGETSITRPDISFAFNLAHGESSDPEGARQTLLYATDKPAQRAERTHARKSEVRKVDDLTDCFLQAAAWVAWEENRMGLYHELRALNEEFAGKTFDDATSMEKMMDELRKTDTSKDAKTTTAAKQTRKVTVNVKEDATKIRTRARRKSTKSSADKEEEVTKASRTAKEEKG